jgi:hypothetical protein
MRNRSSLAVLGAAFAATTACASIVHGTRQNLGVSSTPSGATVSVDNKPLGTTPTVAKLTRKEPHVVRVELDGYRPVEVKLVRSTSGWVWGNIVFGGLIGVAVDASNGAMYKLTPAQVSATLVQVGAQVPASKDGLYIGVVLEPDARWQWIGQLQRE